MGVHSEAVFSGDEDLARYLEEIERFPVLDAGAQAELAGAAAAGDEGAATALVESNLRLVVALARRYSATGVPILDLIQEGNLGLVQAVERYDPAKGFAFSSYASWWIRQAIVRGISSAGKGVQVGVQTDLDLVQQGWDRLRALRGRQPTIEELAEGVGLPEAELLDILGRQPF